MEYPGLLQSRISSLSHERSECSVEMIGECASGLSNIGGPLSSKQSKDSVVENRKHLGRMTHAQLGMIFTHRGIASIMQSVFDSPMPSGQFQSSCGVSQTIRQTRHAIAHLRFRDAKRIGALAFQFEHLRQFGPRAVVG